MIRIDWRQQLDELGNFLGQDGGVVHVRSQADSGASIFARLVRKAFEDASHAEPRLTLRVNPQDPSTHYFTGILAHLSVLMGGGPTESPIAPINIGTDIKAGGDVHMMDISVSSGGNAFNERASTLREIPEVLQRTRDFGAKGRLCLLFFESHKHDCSTLQEFRNLLWDGGLEELCDDGLLLIDVSDDRTDGCEDWPPTPNLRIDLPRALSGDSAEHARTDLAGIALEHGLCQTHEAADVFASTLLATSGSVSDLHARAALGIARMGGP